MAKCKACGAENVEAFNKLGECKSCHGTRVDKLRQTVNQLPENLRKWIAACEEGYAKKTIRYSDEIDVFSKSPEKFELKAKHLDAQLKDLKKDYSAQFAKAEVNLPELVKVKGAKVDLAKLLPAQRGTLINNGLAENFLGRGKNFQLMPGKQPSKAVRRFINGQLTVCECEGMMRVVFLNAICDWAGDDVFDIAFAELLIDSSTSTRFNQPYWDLADKPGEEACAVGDWLYIAHEKDSAETFRSLAEKRGRGAAATGWNLLTIAGGGAGQNRYMGFGMGGGQGMTLPAVRNSMINSVGGNPEDRSWSIPTVWRRRLDGGDLTTFVSQQLVV